MSPSIPFLRFLARKIPKLRGSGHFFEMTGQTFRQINPCLAAKFSGFFADMESPGDECGKTKDLNKMRYTRSVTVFYLCHCSCLTGLTAIY